MTVCHHCAGTGQVPDAAEVKFAAMIQECDDKRIEVKHGHIVKLESAAIVAGVAVHTVRNWISSKKLTRHKIGGGRVYVSLRELAAMN